MAEYGGMQLSGSYAVCFVITFSTFLAKIYIWKVKYYFGEVLVSKIVIYM